GRAFRGEMTILGGEYLVAVVVGPPAECLDRSQQASAEVGEAVSQQYFHTAPWVAWTNAEVSS
ncbi:hypothetical protein ACFQ1S_40610, partial [Kibdelosporangium lantanae]